MTKIATNTVAKASVAFVTVAMMFTLVAPAKAATTTELEAQIAALLAQIATLQAQMGGGTTTTTCSVPAQPLTIGSQGAEVTALQNFLINAGEVIPAGATGYFGSQTQAALASWQASNGVSPAVGYYGPVTKSAMEAACVVTTPDDGDTDTDTDTDSDTLGSDEGDVDSVREVAADESTLSEGEFGGVLAFELEIEGDVEINRLDFYLAEEGALTDNADDYFTSATLFVDGDEVAELDVDDFDQDDYDILTLAGGAGEGDDYRLRFSGLDLVFEDGDEPEFQLAFEAMNSIDTADQAADWEVGLESIRYVDGAGFTDTWTDADAQTINETFGFSAEDMAELSVKESSDNPDISTFEIDTDDDSSEYDVFVFEIEEENGVDVNIQDLRVTITTGVSTTESSVVDSATLYHNGDELASESVSDGGVIDFENIDVDIEADGSEEFTVALVFKGTDDHSPNSTVTVAFTSVRDAKDENGNDEGDMTISGTPSSETHTVRADGVILTADSDNHSTAISDTNGDTAGGETGDFQLKFDVEAFADDMYLPFGATIATSSVTAADSIIYVIEDENGTALALNGSGKASTTAVVSVTGDESGSYYEVLEGENASETVTLDVKFTPMTDGYYRARIYGVNYNVGAAGAADTMETASPESDFRTDFIYIDV